MEEKAMVVGIEIEKDSRYNLYSCMEDAKLLADEKLKKIEETTKSIKEVKPECDKLDYALAAGVGLLSGIIDIFLVGSPEDSYFCKMTDKWFEKYAYRVVIKKRYLTQYIKNLLNTEPIVLDPLDS